MRKALQSASLRWMGVKLNIAAWRHIAIAISRWYCQKNPFWVEEQRQVANEWEEIEDDPWDLQSSYTTYTTRIVYARELIEGNSSIFSRREKFRLISQAWHQFLGFGSSHEGLDTDIRLKRKRQAEDDLQEVQRARWKRLKNVDIY